MNRTLVAMVLLPAVALAAPVPKVEKGENKLHLDTGGRIVAISADGTGEEKVFDDKYTGTDQRVSPNGKLMLSYRRATQKNGAVVEGALAVREVGQQPKELLAVGFDLLDVRWSSDSKSLYGQTHDPAAFPKKGATGGLKTWAIDVASGKKTDLDVPDDYRLLPLTAGDDLLFTRYQGDELVKGGGRVVKYETVRSPASKFAPEVVIPTDAVVNPRAVSLDGKRWVVCRNRDQAIGVFTVGEKEPVFWDGGDVKPHAMAASPDGSRVAYIVIVKKPGKGNAPAATYTNELWVSDLNGKNGTKVFEQEKALWGVVWR